jgi:hypothetical protein
MHDPGGVLDEEQHLDPLAEYGVNVEQVAGDDPFALGLQKLPPTRAVATWSGAQTSAFEDVSYGARRNIDAYSSEFTADPHITPARVLPSQPQHRRTDVRRC